MENPETRKPKVLYVDDAKEYSVLFTSVLKSDYEIFTALTGREGLHILEKEDIQVVVSDQRMPEMSGEEFLEQVANLYPDILRFMISGFSDFKAVVDAVNRGQIQAYFHKPIEPEEIKRAINEGLEIAGLKKRNKEILQELESVNNALENADRNKNIFLQILSKELNKPLNEVRATVQIFKNRPISEDLKNLVNILDKNVSKFELLSSLANQITLLKTNGRKLKVDGTDTTEVIENLFIEVSEKLKKRKIKIELNEESPNLLIKGELSLVISCLENIIDSALDHTPDEGKITIRTGKDKEMVFIEVIDEGMNCPKEYIKSITDFFSTNKEFLDLNLNLRLVLAKQIMDVHMGRVECHFNEKEGRFKLLFHVHHA